MNISALKKISFSPEENDFLIQNEACRIASCRKNVPHVVPVSYVFENDAFYFATDYGTKKLENIKSNSLVALTVDVYSSVGNRAVCIQGHAKLIESGSNYKRLYKEFHKKFEWVRKAPWNEGEAPFVEVKPFTKVSWGID